ncbi:ROK family transcriptional regulator [Pantoea sp. A4]|uniref:ROK family transcriptional regulator n=1 Tax=Pantoea sp. A4 TaxID=1225184 RepID=UPI0003819C9A|nr:ROK family protein [Pantoea sp. A4]
MKEPGKGPALLRSHNQRRVIAEMRRRKATSRQDLSAALTLSKNTVSLIIDDLLALGVVDERGPLNKPLVGRPKIEISLRADKLLSAGIMLERDRIHWSICDCFSVVVEEAFIPLHNHQVESVLEQLADICRSLTKAWPALQGIAIGFPGIVDTSRGWLHLSLPLGWQDVDLMGYLQPVTRLPLMMLNNVKAAALFAVQQAQLDHTSSHFYLRIAEGVGGALVQQGRLMYGDSWTAGEVGHLTVDPEGDMCLCGRRGCLEGLISVAAVNSRLALRQAGLSWESRHLAPEIVAEVMQLAGDSLGKVLSQLSLLIDPANIIIDAPWSEDTHFIQAVYESFNACSLPLVSQHTALHFLPERVAPAQGLALAVTLHDEELLI